MIPLCAANGISQIVWSPLGQGVLSGKYDPDRPPPSDSRAASQEMGGFIGRLMQPQVLRAVQQLKPVAEEAGLTLPQFALAWVLREPNVASAIIGASRPEQVRENAAASGVIVDTQLFVRAEQILDEALGGVTASRRKVSTSSANRVGWSSMMKCSLFSTATRRAPGSVL